MSESSIPEDIRQKSTSEVADDLMKQSQEILERGARVTAELDELKHRAEDAMNWRKQLSAHSGLALSLTAGVSFLLFLVLRKR